MQKQVESEQVNKAHERLFGVPIQQSSGSYGVNLGAVGTGGINIYPNQPTYFTTSTPSTATYTSASTLVPK